LASHAKGGVHRSGVAAKVDASHAKVGVLRSAQREGGPQAVSVERDSFWKEQLFEPLALFE
jgi:hypothetical protein